MKKQISKKRILILTVAVVIAAALTLIFFIGVRSIKSSTDPESSESSSSESQAADQKEIPSTLHYVDKSGAEHDVDVVQSAAMNDYDFSKLSNDGTNIVYDDSRYTLQKGIDVSDHQGAIDWTQVKAAGYDFAIIRIAWRGYGSSGSLAVDDRALENISGAKAAGLSVGVYVFSQAVNTEEAEAEAQLVIDTLGGQSLDLPVVFDEERIDGETARTDNLSASQQTDNAIAFCEKIKAAGLQPMIYADMNAEAMYYDIARITAYPIWYADYQPAPQTPYQFEYWQYSESGSVPGISGSVDLNVRFVKK